MEINVDVRAAIEAPKAEGVRQLSFPVTYTVRYTLGDGAKLVKAYAGEWTELIYMVSMILQGKRWIEEVPGAIEAEIWFNGKMVIIMSGPVGR